MELNTKVWGSGVNIDYQAFEDGAFLGIDVSMSPISTLVNRTINLNEQFDQSILIGTNLKNPNSIVMYCNKASGTPELTGFTNAVDTGVYLGVQLGNRYGGLNGVYPARIGYGQSENNSDIRPVLKFPFRDICFLIQLYVCKNKSVTSSGKWIDCDSYFYTSEETNNPYIVAIRFVPFIGSNKNRSSNAWGSWYNYFMPLLYGDLENLGIDTEYGANNMFPFYNPSDSYLRYGGNYSVYYDHGFNVTDWIFVTPYGAKLWEFVAGIEVHTHFLGGRNDVLKIAANTGFFCATTTASAKNADLKKITDPHIIIGKMNDEGAISDKVLTGSDIKGNTLQDTWTKTTDTGNGFNGIANTDPNNYTDKIELNTPTLSNVNVFNRSFAVNSTNVRQLADFLWNADETKFQEIVKGLALMGENPMNGIIDLRLFPFNVALKNSATQAEHIVIGRTDTGVSGIKLTENVNSLIDLGECTFFTKFKNFLDYEPYTTAQLYIPYIGVVPVSTAEFMGHKISVKMIVDYTTGAGTAIVFKDDIPFIYRNGVVGVSIPMTGTDSSTYANTVIGNVVSGVSQIATAGASSVTSFENANVTSQISATSSTASAFKSAVGASGQRTGAVVSGAGGIIGGMGNIYSGFTTPVQYQSAGASSPSVATWQPQKCYFIIDRPILQVPDNYGRTVGYACEITGKLSDFKGFTVVSNPEINFKCTDNERQYMINMLQGGVFV